LFKILTEFWRAKRSLREKKVEGERARKKQRQREIRVER
jgi:hypothetical protein